MKWLGTRLRYALLILLASSAFATTADEFETLQADGRLQLTRSISPSENLVPGQKITLTLKVATDRWFSLSLIHISEPTRLGMLSRMPSSA